MILDPEFQRRYVWDNKKAVIDGQQRLRSFFRFLNNEFKLRGLSVLSELNGKYFKDLDKEKQRKIEDTTLSEMPSPHKK
ncbi:hypothetical protein B6U71_05165 [Euryarchaeota archaeon ex4484_178]|nr:MAG: hypothetical protein B6U71_05165 [Euryarchaeota archaeon ex4484_178]